jgi:hypothetical protein
MTTRTSKLHVAEIIDRNRERKTQMAAWKGQIAYSELCGLRCHERGTTSADRST